jgi:S1-C subfamily serine protease
MVTTAMAIGEVATVRVMRASGGVGEVPVVAVGAGFAYLQTDVSLLRSGFASSALAAQGDTLTVLADEQVTFRLGDDTLARLDPASVAEGTPVVNEAGSLVGLCTRGNGVVELLAIEPPPAAPDDADPQRPSQPSQPQPTVTQPSVTTASSAASTTVTIATSSPASAASSTPTTTSTSPAASSTTSSIATTVGATTTVAVTPGTPTTVAVARGTPWIGVRLAGAGGAIPLAITSITAGSPAAAAGLVVGDVLRAVDGVTVTSVDDVLRRVGSRAPGDTIVVTVDGGAAGREVRVVLGEQTL